MFVSHAHFVGKRPTKRTTSHVQKTFQYYKSGVFKRRERAADSEDIPSTDGTTLS